MGGFDSHSEQTPRRSLIGNGLLSTSFGKKKPVAPG